MIVIIEIGYPHLIACVSLNINPAGVGYVRVLECFGTVDVHISVIGANCG